jgi:hypothetical protein
LVVIACWIVFVGGTRRDEMIVGVGVFLLSGAFVYHVWRIETLDFDLRRQDVAQGWRVPWYVLTDAGTILAVLAKDLLAGKRAGSFYRVCGFRTSESDPRIIARGVLAVFYTTMSPNSIVIGIDPQQGRMIFHQLDRSSIPIMTKALGAQSGG